MKVLRVGYSETEDFWHGCKKGAVNRPQSGGEFLRPGLRHTSSNGSRCVQLSAVSR
ncbi:MAG: hypothetical protein ACOX7H_08535 [Bacillota bacterium]